MSAMNKTYFGEGLIDVMDAKEVVSDEFVIKVCRVVRNLAYCWAGR
jgi:hypothetical protein